MENKLPNTETIINTTANTSNVSTSNLTGTASGKNAPVMPVNSNPNAVPNSANMRPSAKLPHSPNSHS